MNDWISVKDRLPKPFERVIAAYETNVICTTQMSDNQTFLHEGIHGNVTHWMPLPEPPKGECRNDCLQV